MTKSRLPDCFSALLIVASYALSAVPLHAFAQVHDPKAGQQLFAENCARCHGEQGGGTDHYPTPLAGELSVPQLAKQLQETMPEDDPGTLSDEQANMIAEFIHDDFYSTIARAHNRPPRIELSRLTVRQYRRTVADLVGSFRSSSKVGEERGLKGEYFNGRNFQKSAGERVDPEIAFDFGSEAPLAEIKDADLYSVRWRGSLLPHETGWHDIVVRSEQAVRLWLNNDDEPIIDGWVKSGDDNEYTAKVFLIDSRAYPIKFDFSRSNQGVSDEKQHEAHEVLQKATVSLLWKTPHGTLRPIPSRQLAPGRASESLIVATPFPPDDRSYGWERGTSISPSWDEATTSAAIAAAEYIGQHLDELADAGKADDRTGKLKQFCLEFVERAFRRPLDDEIKNAYIDVQFEGVEDPEVAVRRVVLLTLKSPRFLYREVGTGDARYDTAARLSYALWDAPPDEELLREASEDKLSQLEVRRQQAERMLHDPRAASKLRQFLLTWLQVDGDVDLAKNPDQYAEFTDEAIADLRTSLELFLDELVASPESDYRQLFLADEVFLNARLGRMYGAVVEGDDFVKQRLDDGRRAGVLTHPYIMARFAHGNTTSPIHRGVFLARNVLGQALKPPPEAVAPLAPELHPDLTTRERVILQTREAACMTCHNVINPLGFTLERFDAIGRYRDAERERQIDDAGHYVSLEGDTVEFAGARALAEFLASSDEVSQAFVDRLFHYLVQQSVQAYGPDMSPNMHRQFVESGYNIRELAIEIAVAASPVDRDADAQSLANNLAPNGNEEEHDARP